MRTLFIGLVSGATLLPVAQGASLSVPNFSFESPVTDFASPEINAWQKAPKPFWHTNDDNGPFAWNNVMGQFLNTSKGSPDHIDNMDQTSTASVLPMFAIRRRATAPGSSSEIISSALTIPKNPSRFSLLSWYSVSAWRYPSA